MGAFKNFRSIIVLSLALVTAVLLRPSDSDSGPVKVKLGKIPSSAEIVFHKNHHIFVMDRDGQNAAQITFDNPRSYEHAAVSCDHRFVVANEQLPNPKNVGGGFSRLWLFDLQEGTESRLLPDFITAGNGGVDWDCDNFIYFSAKEKDPIADPRSPQEFLMNAGANQVFKMKYDGTGLQQLTDDPKRPAADVSVSEDERFVYYNVLFTDPTDPVIDLWRVNTDGTNPEMIFSGGKPFILSVHDPEGSPDNQSVVFSRVNPEVAPNFPNIPAANTAHDIYKVNTDGTGLTRLTKPGPISIAPDWRGDDVIYLFISEKDRYSGACMVHANGVDQTPKRLMEHAQMPKWIPNKTQMSILN